MGDPVFELRRRHTVTVSHYAVTGAPPVPCLLNGGQIEVRHAEIRHLGGVFNQLTLRGRLVGGARTEWTQSYWDLYSVPVWIRALCESAQ